MLLSIIIPVYNAEKYLQDTVDSILKQASLEYELILVNDGSSDASPVLCDSLASQHSFISVVHKSNSGVSSARNTGIEIAKGKYLAFIDSDDKIGAGMITDMLNEIEEKNADKVFCGLEEIQEDGYSIARIANLPSRILLDRNFIVTNLLYNGCITNSYMNSVCGGFYKTQIILDNNLRFENRPMGEDWLFNMKYCDLAESIVYIDKPYYKYLRNNNSAMSRYQPRQFDLWLENRSFRDELVKRYNFKVDQKLIDSVWITKVLFYSFQVIDNDKSYQIKLQNIFNTDEFKKALCNSNVVSPFFFIPVVWFLKNNMYHLSMLILKLCLKINKYVAR